MVFSYARKRDFLKGHTGLDPQLLDRITEMTARFEVSMRSREEWERTILTAYDRWRNIRDWRGGRLHADLECSIIDIFPPKTASTCY